MVDQEYLTIAGGEEHTEELNWLRDQVEDLRSSIDDRNELRQEIQVLKKQLKKEQSAHSTVEQKTEEVQQTVDKAINFRRAKRATVRGLVRQLEQLDLETEDGTK